MTDTTASVPGWDALHAFRSLLSRYRDDPKVQEAIAWQEGVKQAKDAEHFATEAIWVICNSGMKHTVARLIEARVFEALREGVPVSTKFGHVGKADAMERIWHDRNAYFDGFMAAVDKVAYLETLPWIGGITKYHLAKNLGVDCAKPDVHLARLAALAGTGVQSMCEAVAKETGYRTATVDLLLWWGCAHGELASRTGELTPIGEAPE